MKSDSIKIYEEVTNESRKRFPRYFWKEGENYNYSEAAEITRYLIEDILKWNDEDIKNKMCCEIFFKYKLKGMLWTLFNDSFYEAVNNAYPGKFKEWEFKNTPRNFWNEKTGIIATRWLYKEKLGLSDDQILSNISRKLFVENGLDTMMHVLYSNSATKAIKSAFGYLF